MSTFIINSLCLCALVATKFFGPQRHQGTKLFCFLICGIIHMSAIAQANTDIILFDLTKKDGLYQINNPKNISNNPGYDNQPSFTADGKHVLFAGTQADAQTDIMRYEIKSGKLERISKSAGSEYSPTLTPDKKFISTIILEKSGRQLLWKYPVKGGEPQIVIDELVIGYHCWIDNDNLLAFVLGRPVTLQHINLKTGEKEIIAAMIGRSLHKIPGQDNFSYISKADPENKWEIISLDIKTMKASYLATTPTGSEDLAWTPDRKILMGKGTELFQCDPYGDKTWKKIADLQDFGLKSMTRLAINTKGNKIAIVVEE